MTVVEQKIGQHLVVEKDLSLSHFKMFKESLLRTQDFWNNHFLMHHISCCS